MSTEGGENRSCREGTVEVKGRVLLGPLRLCSISPGLLPCTWPALTLGAYGIPWNIFRAKWHDREEQQEREQDHQPQSAQLLHVGAGREMVSLSDVEDEVRRRVDQPGDQRHLHDAPLEQERRGHQQYRKSEVQRAVVSDQVLVIRAQCRDQTPPGQREVNLEEGGRIRAQIPPKRGVAARSNSPPRSNPRRTGRLSLSLDTKAPPFIVPFALLLMDRQELFPADLAVPVLRRCLRPLAQSPRNLAEQGDFHDPPSPPGGLEVRPREVNEGPHLRPADVWGSPGWSGECELRAAMGDLSYVYGLEQKAPGRHHHGEAIESLDQAQNKPVELGGPEDGPRHLGVLDNPLGLQLHPVVGKVRVAVDADDGDKQDVRDARPLCRLEQAPGSIHVHLARSAEGARGAVDYRANSLDCFLESFSGAQISTYRSGMPVPAHHPHVLPSRTQPVDYPAHERAGPARYKDLVRVHCQPPSIAVSISACGG